MNFNEVIKICWPYIIQTRNDRLMGYPSIEFYQIYRLGFTDDLLLEQDGDEIVRVVFSRGGILMPVLEIEEKIYNYIKEQVKVL